MSEQTVKIGTAGWSIPSAIADRFPGEGGHLARYAQRLPAVEINSSFYRPHRRKTYERWAATAPDAFRFSVKLPKAITHERRLVETDDLLDRFLDEVAGLGPKLGPVLIQLPPSLAFDPAVARAFFDALRRRFDGQLACEPRHASWFTDAADTLLVGARTARVAADPALNARAAVAGGWPDLTYRRLHGAPRIYYSDYPEAFLKTQAFELSTCPAGADCWCILDNTALGHATRNALDLQRRLIGYDEQS
jgi:uncharacterized protein YecE (DUF72 family)